MLTITEIKSYISEAITQYQSVYVDADIVPVTVCSASRRRAVRNRVINECGLDYKEDAYGTDAEVIFGPNGKQILIYQSMMKTKQQVFHALWHEFGHLLSGDEKQYGINLERDTPMRSGYAVFNEFVAEYIAYTVNDAEPFRNAMGSHIYLQMAFQEERTINSYWLSRYFAIVLGDSTVSEDEFAFGQSLVSPAVWNYINQILNVLISQIKKPDFWITDAEFLETLGCLFDDMFHLVFMGA